MKKQLSIGFGIFMILFFTAVLISCGAVRILTTESAPEFTISAYKTFNFSEMTIDPSIDTVYLKRVNWIKDEIADYFRGRGLSQSETNPDMIINIGIVVEQKIQTRETSFLEAPVYIGQRNYHWEIEEVEVGRYHEGTVTVDLIDRQKEVMMWQGVAQSIIEKKDAKSKKNIAAGVPKLFAELR